MRETTRRGRRSILITLAVVLAAGLGVIFVASRLRSNAPDSPAGAVEPAEQQPVRTDAPPPQSAGASETPNTGVIPRPQADWLAAAANPVLVEVVTEGQPREHELSPAGGELSAASPTFRAHIVVPPGAVRRTEKVTIAFVTEFRGAPVPSGVIAGVRLAPENIPLQKPIELRIQPTPRYPLSPDEEVAAFAVRGRELHLYPGNIYEVPRSRGRAEIRIPLARLGTFGIARATVAEAATLGPRVPSNYISRLQHQIAATLLNPTAAARVSSSEAPFPWTYVSREGALRSPLFTALTHAARALPRALHPTVYAAPAGETPGFVLDLIVRIRQVYEQVVVSRFRNLRVSDCQAADAWGAINAYLEWRATVELLLPIEALEDRYKDYREMVEAHNRAVEERRAKLRGRGFTDEQIDAIDDEFDRLRKILEEWKIEMEPAVTEVLRNVFREMYRCCQGTDPKQEYLDAMSTAVRWAALRGVSPLEEDELGKMSECGCRIASYRPGAPEGFVGTISFEEHDDRARTVTAGRQTTVNTEKLDFTQTSHIFGLFDADTVLVDSFAYASMRRTGDSTSPGDDCMVYREYQEDVSGRDEGRQFANVIVFPQRGEYQLTAYTLDLRGSGTARKVFRLPGCRGFTKPYDRSEPVINQGIVPVVTRTVTAKLNPQRPRELRGSEVFEVDDREFPTPKRLTMKWEITRCAVPRLP